MKLMVLKIIRIKNTKNPLLDSFFKKKNDKIYEVKKDEKGMNYNNKKLLKKYKKYFFLNIYLL